MKGDIFPGNSGEAGPMGVQYFFKFSLIPSAASGGAMLKRRARLLASCGWSVVVVVALSRYMP